MSAPSSNNARLAELLASKARREAEAAAAAKSSRKAAASDSDADAASSGDEQEEGGASARNIKAAPFRGRAPTTKSAPTAAAEQAEEEEEEQEEELEEEMEDKGEEPEEEEQEEQAAEHASSSSSSSEEEDDEEEDGRKAVTAYGTTQGKAADAQRTKALQQQQQRKKQKLADTTGKATDQDTAAAAADDHKRLLPTVMRNPQIGAKHENPVVGERFKRGDLEFEVVSTPEFKGPLAFIESKITGKNSQTPNWSKGVIGMCFDARNTAKPKGDVAALETYVQLSRFKCYAVSQMGAQAIMKNDPHVTASGMREYKASARNHRNLIPSVSKTSQRGQCSWMPWCLYLHSKQGDSAAAGAAAAGGAGSKRKSPGAGASAAAASAAVDVPPLLIEKAKQFIQDELLPFCNKDKVPAMKPARLDCAMNNYAKMWKVAELAELDVLMDGRFKGKTKSAAAEALKLQVRMFLMIHPIGIQMIQELHAQMAKEATDAMEQEDGGDV